jgi:hypothetical protein
VEHSTAVEPVQQPLALQGAEVPAHGHLRGADERGEVLVAGRDSMPCLTDELALGVMRRAWECGVRVPDDLAVVGFDDIEDGRYARPSLTTVWPDKSLRHVTWPYPQTEARTSRPWIAASPGLHRRPFTGPPWPA